MTSLLIKKAPLRDRVGHVSGAVESGAGQTFEAELSLLFFPHSRVKIKRLQVIQISSFMQLFWHGMSSIRIEAKFAEKESTLLTDPYSNDAGLRFPRTLAPDLLVLSHQDRSRYAVDAVENKPFIISDPGEYEVKGLFVHGIQDTTAESEKNRQVIFRFDIEGISMAFLGQLNRPLTAFEVEELGDVDILVIPVGGGETLDPKKASDVISAVEPRLIIPISYDLPGLKTKLATVDQFCKQLGGTPREDMQKLKIAKKDLPVDEMKIVVLERA